jgi:hypothetical protein
MHRIRLLAVIVGMLAVFTLAVTAATAVALGRPAQETTVPNTDTTTIAPTTTVEPTTTTVEATTTTTQPATTTTSSSTTTTTVAPGAGSTTDNNSRAGRVIIGILAVLAVAAITAMIIVRRNAKRDKAEWTNLAASALRDADLTRDLLAGEARPGQPEEAARLTAVRDNVERVAANFDGLAVNAPAEDLRQHALGVANSLRGYFFALQAEQLLHSAPTPPTGDQLASADATKRMRTAELDAAIDAIRTYVTPQPTAH